MKMNMKMNMKMSMKINMKMNIKISDVMNGPAFWDPGRVMALATGSGPGRAGPGLMPGQAGPGDYVVGPGRAGSERVKIHSSF